MDNPIADSTAATVIANTATTNAVKLFTEDEIIKKVKEIERSITSMDIRNRIILPLLMITPNILITKNMSKKYIILILNPLLSIHRLNLILIGLETKREIFALRD